MRYSYNITIPLKEVFEVLALARQKILKHSGKNVSPVTKQDLYDEGIYIKTLRIGEYTYQVKGSVMRGPLLPVKGRLLERIGFKRKMFVKAIMARDFILIIPAQSFPPNTEIDIDELRKFS